jgi:hypothetical protein
MSRHVQMPLQAPAGQAAVDSFVVRLQARPELRPATVRNYVSDLRHFFAWCETQHAQGLDTPREQASGHELL